MPNGNWRLTLIHRIMQGDLTGKRVGIIQKTEYQYTHNLSAIAAMPSKSTQADCQGERRSLPAKSQTEL